MRIKISKMVDWLWFQTIQKCFKKIDKLVERDLDWNDRVLEVRRQED